MSYDLTITQEPEYSLTITGDCPNYAITFELVDTPEYQISFTELVVSPTPDETDPVFTAWLSGKFTTGARITGVDAGAFGQISVNDDYIYVCVVGGVAGVAIWKRSVLFQT